MPAVVGAGVGVKSPCFSYHSVKPTAQYGSLDAYFSDPGPDLQGLTVARHKSEQVGSYLVLVLLG